MNFATGVCKSTLQLVRYNQYVSSERTAKYCNENVDYAAIFATKFSTYIHERIAKREVRHCPIRCDYGNRKRVLFLRVEVGTVPSCNIP